MSLDETIFGWAYKQIKEARSDRERERSHLWSIELKRIQILANGLSPELLKVSDSPHEAQSFRDCLFVKAPEKNLSTESAKIFALFKLYFHVACLQNPKLVSQSARGLWNEAISSLIADLPSLQERILENETRLSQISPQYSRLWNDWKSPSIKLTISKKSLHNLFPRVPVSKMALSKSSESENSRPTPQPNQSISAPIELQGAPQVEVIQPDPESQNPLVHVFEKLLTADSYQGGSKPIDSSNELSQHADALKELHIDKLIRVAGSSEGSISVDIELENGSPEANRENATFEYDEWFKSESRYRRAWCQVKEFSYPIHENEQCAPRTKELVGLRRRIEAILHRRIWLNRQKQGVDLDIDQIIRNASEDRHRKQEERIFIDRLKRQMDLGVLLLIDLSSSTDSYVLNRRIIDELKLSLQKLTFILSDFPSGFSVAGFTSDSRLKCSFGWIKQFEEPWALTRARLPLIEPKDYTRIGPALRHAHRVLQEKNFRNPSIVLVTDAKPTDYDRYEGHHGRADVKKAVTEILSSGIQFKALTFSKIIRREFRETFGEGKYQVVRGAREITIKVIEHLEKSAHRC